MANHTISMRHLGQVEVTKNKSKKNGNVIVGIETIIIRVIDDHKYIDEVITSTWIIEIYKLWER